MCSWILWLCFGIVSALPSAPAAEERYNYFNIDLLQAVGEEVEGNLILSPTSAKLALTILAEGTGGRTRQEILSALRLPGDNTKIREISQRTFASLKRIENGTEIDTATRLWIEQAAKLSPNYPRILQQYYGSDVQLLNFVNAESSANTINKWVRLVTREKIQTLVDSGSIGPETRLVLTSALYFKGRWLKSFDKQLTRVRCFYVPNEPCQNTHFMENMATYRYAHIPSLDADVIEIPYSDNKTAMLILLPTANENDQNLRILSKDLSYVSVSQLLASLQDTEVFLSIPKFSIESKLDLRSPLIRMGIRDMFEGSSNLTGIAADNFLRVGSVIQDAKIEVDEDGTIAAAVTGLTIVPFMGSNTQNFKANRPFIFMIVDLETKGTLFAGRVIRPNLNDNNIPK